MIYASKESKSVLVREIDECHSNGDESCLCVIREIVVIMEKDENVSGQSQRDMLG